MIYTVMAIEVHSNKPVCGVLLYFTYCYDCIHIHIGLNLVLLIILILRPLHLLSWLLMGSL